MMLIEETTVPDAVLPVDDLKAHLRLGTGFGEDTTQDEVLSGFLRAAVSAIEARTGKILITRRFSWTLSFWRDRDGQGLRVAPVTELTRFARVNADGEARDVDAAAWWLERDSLNPRLRARGAALPVIPHNGTAVIEFDAGFGASWTDVPADLQQAVKMLAAHYYEYRHDTSLSDGCMPFGVTSLIQRYKVMRLGAGSRR